MAFETYLGIRGESMEETKNIILYGKTCIRQELMQWM